MSEMIKQIFRWVLLIFLQIGIFNNLELFGLLNPFVYIFTIIMLPLGIPRSLLLLIGFLTGWTIDIFSNTGGLHAAATTLLAFTRPWWVGITIPRTNYDELNNIRIKDIEFGQFITYVALLTGCHHLVLYWGESMAWADFWLIVGKTLVNSLFTILMIIAFRYFDFSQGKLS